MAGKQMSIEDHVTCSICMDLYDDPLALPCMHSFCRRCLHGLITSGHTLRCPECRTDISLSRKGIDEMPKNFQLGSIVESYKKDHQGSPPPSSTSRATYCRQHQSVCQILCKPCQQSVCVKCIVSDHDRHKLTYPPEGRVDLPEEFEDAVCQAHTKNYKLYCRDCNTTVCMDCIVQQHSTHSFGHIAGMHSQFLGEMNDCLSELESRQRVLRATQKSCRVLAQKTQVDSQKKLQQLTAYFSRVKEMVEKREDTLRREITGLEKQSVERYLYTADISHKKEAELHKVIDELKRLAMEDKIQFLKEFKSKQPSVSRLLGKEEDDAPPRNRSVDDGTLVLQNIEAELSNVRWEWKKEDIKPIRKAPTAPPERKPRAKDDSNKRRTHQERPELQNGAPVKRGKDWRDGNKDGGPGHYGSVVQITLDPHTYLVRWPNGNKGSYKYEPSITEEVVPP